MEWAFGLPRGGLWYYLRSKENIIYRRFCKDIREMFRRGDFLSHPNGLYRYVFIPISEAGLALRKKLSLQPQTKEDLNNGVLPDEGEPMLPGSEDLPVVECSAHPFYMASYADRTLDRVPSTSLSGQWHGLAYAIADEWRRSSNNFAPQWFVDEPSYDCDDTTLSATEATGYIPPSPRSQVCTVRKPDSIPRDASIDDDDDDDDTKKVCHWFTQYDPKAKPPRDDPRSPAQVRRSRRLLEKMGLTPPSPSESEPPLSPVRRGPLRPRDPVRCPPAWARRNGRFPTHRFTSNDWAYFRHHVALASCMKPTPASRKRSTRSSRTT
ncbi:hypothetical protein FB107DRAFT_294105 [Schizophyllum commune]